jgi:hypothetical protein
MQSFMEGTCFDKSSDNNAPDAALTSNDEGNCVVRVVIFLSVVCRLLANAKSRIPAS